jgi:hypothetical protein
MESQLNTALFCNYIKLNHGAGSRAEGPWEDPSPPLPSPGKLPQDANLLQTWRVKSEGLCLSQF